MKTNDKLAAVIQSQDEYIKLLVEELNSAVPLAAVNGWQSTRRQAGAAARIKIAAAKEAAKEEV